MNMVKSESRCNTSTKLLRFTFTITRRPTMAKKKSSGKAKGLDGKACWKGYKLAGTKMKGGKRVDNCVKSKGKKK